VHYYAIALDPEKLYLEAVRFARAYRTYSWDWAVKAAYTPCLPCNRCSCSCDTRDPTTNCVGSVLSVIAGAIDSKATLDRAHARRVLGMTRFYTEDFFPSEALRLLQATTTPDGEQLVPLAASRTKTLPHKGRAGAPLPTLLLRW
jgi:hypothetical protein